MNLWLVKTFVPLALVILSGTSLCGCSTVDRQHAHEVAKLTRVQSDLASFQSATQKPQVVDKLMLQDMIDTLDVTAAVLQSVRSDLLLLQDVIEMHDLQQKLFTQQRTIVLQWGRAECQAIKDRVLSQNHTKIAEQGYSPSGQPGQLTLAIDELAALRDKLQQFASAGQGLQASPEEFRQLANDIGDLQERIHLYRIACFSEFIMNRLQTTTTTYEKSGSDQEAKIKCVLDLMKIQLPQEDIAYGVAAELRAEKERIFTALPEKLKQESGQRLMNEIKDNCFKDRLTVTINDF